MQSCEAHQALLLEYLFDVLDELERTALEQHLAGCAQCSAALEKARRQQHLLAAAARGDFSDVRFTAPPAEVPAILPLPRRRLIRVRRWATAAAVLVALSVPAWLIGSTAIEYAQAKKAADDGDAAVANETTKMRQIDTDLRRIPGLRQLKIVEVVNAQRERELKLVVTGPRSVQSGAPTAFQVQTLNFNDQPIEAEVWANVAMNGKELGERINALPAEESSRRIVGSYRLTLPPDLPLAANANVSLRVSARREGGARAEVGEFLVSGHAAYLTHLATDKPMYQPGETVYFRSLSLDPKTLQPAAEDLDLVYTITNPRQAQVYQRRGSTRLLGMNAATKTYSRVVGPDGKELHGVGADAFDLPRNTEGGEYVLSVDEALGRFPRQERRFVVNAYQKHVLEKMLDFNRKSYGPGDEVQALCKATDARGAVKGAAVTASLVIDGQAYGADGKVNGVFPSLTTDEQGTVIIRCKLPTVIEKGQASLGVTFNNGTVTETLSRTVPIVLKKLTVEFFPEGGDLIAGLPNRVYFQVRTPLGKPADIRGRLLQDGKPTDTVLATLTDDKEPGINQGMGRFDFEPKAGSKYEVQVESPLGITDRFALPAVKADGVLLSVPDGVVGAGQPIRVVVRSTKPPSLMVGAYCRGNSLAAVHLTNGQSEAVLPPTTGDGGVCRITVWEEVHGGGKRGVLRPVAERLVYRVPAQQLKVALTTDRASYVPGMKTKLMLETRDEHDQPAPALVMLGVVDKSVLAMADEKTARTMPTHFLLTTEVRRGEDLEYADVLLGSHPRAGEALDLLLGTQGWRRFAEQDPGKFRAAQANVRDGADAERLLVALGQSAPQTRNFAHEQISEVHEQFNRRIDVLAQEYAQAGQAVETAQANSAYLAALERLASYRATWNTVRQTLVPALTASFLLGTIACLILALTRSTVRKALPFYAGMAVCTVVVVLAVGAWNQDTQPSDSNASARVAFAPMANDQFAKARNMERLAEGGAGAEIDEAIDRNRNEERFADEMRKGEDKGRPAWEAARAKADNAKEKAPEMAEKNMKRKAAGDFDLGVPAAAGQIGAGPMLAKRAPAPAMARMPVPERAEKPGDRDGVMEKKEALRREAEQIAGKGELRQPRQQSLVIREYAHVAPPKANPEERSDFAETLFWHPVIVLPDGKADVSFSLSDSVTRFQAIAFAHTTNGRLGAASLIFESKLPFTLLPKTPLEVTAGDRIDIPIGIANNTGAARTIDLAIKQHGNLELLDGKENERLNVPGEAARKIYAVRPTAKQGQAVLTIEGKTNGFGNDTVRSEFRIVPEGFPRAGSISDMLEGGAQHTVKLPEAWIPGTLEMQVQVYASTLSDLQKGLESLLREPGGCFEQTSTASYPNVLILDYLKSSKNANPDVERRARDLLDRGYQRLTSFECQNGQKKMREGYEWFGGTAPPHEALTAYGLLQFRDMARYREVDPVMVQRTQSFLLARRDKQGGFLRNDRPLDTFGRASKPITDAYIVWALTTAGCEEPLTAELDALTKQAGDSKDPYFLSLVANSLINKARTAEAVGLLKKIADAQAADGHLDGADMSITSSRGHDLQIETTALAVLGWLKANPGEFNKPVQKAVDWIGKQRGGYGGFGSTQSTILALKALIAYTKDRPRAIKAGELKLVIGDKEVGTTAFKAGVSDTITLVAAAPEKWLKQGDNKVRVELTGGNTLPYTLAWSYRTKQPASAGDCPLRLETKLAKIAAAEGEVVQLRVKLRNNGKAGQGMAVAVVGLPGGMTIPEDLKQLKEYAKVPEDGSRPLIGAFEIRGRELVLYWRDLQGQQEIEVPIDLICRVPGEYTGPASRAYLYYNSDGKCWIEPLHVAIEVGK